MKLHYYIICILGLIQSPILMAQNQYETQVANQIEQQLLYNPQLPIIEYNTDNYRLEDDLLNFYRRRAYTPAWSNKEGAKKATELWLDLLNQQIFCEQLQNNVLDSLLETEEQLAKGGKKLDQWAVAQKDIILTQTYLLAASYTYRGQVNPDQVKNLQWFLPLKEHIDYPSFLEVSIQTNDMASLFTKLNEGNPTSIALAKKLNFYLDIMKDGGWESVSDSVRKVKFGEEHPSIIPLKKRLITEGIAVNKSDQSAKFNADLLKSIQLYQEMYGLNIDSAVTKATLKCLNVPVEDIVEKLYVNIERTKWMTPHQYSQYIVANIPDYSLKYHHNGEMTQFRTVIGSRGHQTPCFTENMSNVVINPYWNVPYSIARSEIVPNVMKNPKYLKKKKYEIIGGWSSTVAITDSTSIDWTDSKKLKKEYRYRQKPGPWNALGQLKFNFPNQWAIYIHDTPSKSKFKRDLRAFSHGCVRLHNPLDLAEILLKPNFGWTREKIKKTMNSRKTTTVILDKKIPVIITYETAWVDKDGKLNLRYDIYGRDKKIAKFIAHAPKKEEPTVSNK